MRVSRNKAASEQRTYCEHCGNRLDHVGQEPCLKWGKLAFKFFGK